MASTQDPRYVAPATFTDEPAPYEPPPTSANNRTPMNRRVVAALGLLAAFIVLALLAMLTSVDEAGSPLPAERPGQVAPRR